MEEIRGAAEDRVHKRFPVKERALVYYERYMKLQNDAVRHIEGRSVADPVQKLLPCIYLYPFLQSGKEYLNSEDG